jgi:oligoendopeptidase F
VIPVAARAWEHRRRTLGVETLRPWDARATGDAGAAFPHFADSRAFLAGMEQVFSAAHPRVGALFRAMHEQGFLDLGWRPGKAAGGEEWDFPVSTMPYVQVGADGSDDGVALLCHEMGHAFHDFLVLSRAGLYWESHYPDEMAEFAAIALERLVEPHLSRDRGGFLTPRHAAHYCQRAVREVAMHWLPLIVLEDAFQHWLYAEAPDTVTSSDIDEQWAQLSARYQPWFDWNGLEPDQALGWVRSQSIFGTPFYVISYGLAHVGALQLARAAETDPAAVWTRYEAALRAGNSLPLAELYELAGARLPFARAVVRDVARFMDGR